MSSRTSKQSKPAKGMASSSPASRSRSSCSFSSNLAMIELKLRILDSLAKLSDRDTYNIAVEDLEKIIQTLAPNGNGVSMLLKCLNEALDDPKPTVRKESLRLLTLLCSTHSDYAFTHITKIISHIVRRLRDPDSGVRDSCCDAIGSLSSQYLRNDVKNGNLGSVVSLFMKPLFEAMREQNKVVQAGAATCMVKIVDSATDPPVATFQKLCPRVSKYLSSQNFVAKAALLAVVASLSQVGAISSQSLALFLKSIHECLDSTDWATRKAACDTLTDIASHSSQLIADGTASTITILEAHRFDKVKPVRDSIKVALQQWKKIGEKGEHGIPDDKSSKSIELAGDSNPFQTTMGSLEETCNGSSSSSDSFSKIKGCGISDKTVRLLKKKAPVLTDKDLNPEFFRKLESKGSEHLPVEVVVPLRCPNSSSSQAGEELKITNRDVRDRSNQNVNHQIVLQGSGNIKYHHLDKGAAAEFNKIQEPNGRPRDQWNKKGPLRGKDMNAVGAVEQRTPKGNDAKPIRFDADGINVINHRDKSNVNTCFTKMDGLSKGSFVDSKRNWFAIQGQLALLEKQQSHVIDILQDFMGGSHDNMMTLENRVRGLERVVEDMERDLGAPSVRYSSNFVHKVSSTRFCCKHNGRLDYPSTQLSRGGDGQFPTSERFLPSDCIVSDVRGRDPPWMSGVSDAQDSYGHGASRNVNISSRGASGGALSEGGPSRAEHDSEQVDWRA